MERVGLGWAARAAHPALRQLVRRYVGYTQDNVTLPVHRGLPGRSITFIVSLAAPIRLLDGPAFQGVVGGLHMAPSLIEQDRYQQGLQLDLNPLGARALLGVPAKELAKDVVDLGDLPVTWAKTLPERLKDRGTWAERFDLLDEVLTHALKPVTLLSEVQWAWQRMVRSQGVTPVTELAGEVGWSRRHFTERFAREVGLGPKQVSRLIRFERGRDLLRAGHTLADVAALAGYYDQAHLSNEWRALAGCTPTEWIREELPFLQDITGPGRTE
ncbi:helix-turn-helix domain-containing protein [Actinocrispum sp. NPDC049592]|uniref:helix-turn-helix domain-containing protein n=1 Tax=Actinocrispum sp. NPDC049592 TaxID=3154835 RepID=UPI0034163518